MHSTIIFPVLALVASYKVLSILIDHAVWKKYSVLTDIPLLSKSRAEKDKLPGVAIICGGSVSGLFAARICANHFKKVLLIDPEKWITTEKGLEDYYENPNAPKRSRVAQYLGYHHYHLLITIAMSKMFPTFEQELKLFGGKLTQQSEFFYFQGIGPHKMPSGFPSYYGGTYPRTITSTRAGFETMLRRLVLRTCKEVEYVNGTVNDLIYDENTNRVTGVKIKSPNGEITNLEGSLVVDATGPFLGGFHWLKKIPKPPASKSPLLQDLKLSYDPKMSYTYCDFALTPKLEEEFRKYGFPTDADTTSKFYVCFPTGGIDNKQVLFEKGVHLALGSYGPQKRVESIDDIEDFLEELKPKRPLPDFIWEMLNTLRNENAPITFMPIKCPQSVYIKYHEADYLPSNFVVVGDAITQTNPINGQGCSRALVHSIILNALLERTVITNSNGFLPSTFSKQYFIEVKNRTQHTWSTLKSRDYNFPSTIPLPGEDLKTASRFTRFYARLIFPLMLTDPDISGVNYRQTAWLDPPPYVMAPWVVRRAIWGWIKRSSMKGSYTYLCNGKLTLPPSPLRMYLFNVLSTIFIVSASYKVLSIFIKHAIWGKYSILKDIHLLSKSNARAENDKIPGVAIICGGSIAGLFAAQPEKWITTEEGLKDHYDNPTPPKRSRVAQYYAFHHLHLLITIAMKKMFSTAFEKELEHAGGRLTQQSETFYIKGVSSKTPTGFPSYYCNVGGNNTGVYPYAITANRPSFETTLRRLVLQTCTEVEYLNGTVTDLVYDESSNRVTGVKVKRPDVEIIADLEGSLVIDATGSFQGGFRWLKNIPKLSSKSPVNLQDLKISFDPKMVYTYCNFSLSTKVEQQFRKYQFPADAEGDTTSRFYVCLPTGGEDSRQVIIERGGRNLLHFICGGYNYRGGRIESIEDIENFLNEMKPSLKKPLPSFIWEILNTLRSENITTSYMYIKCPPSVYIKYHEADYLPSNFVALGDAVTQVNPINGSSLKNRDYNFPSTIPIQKELEEKGQTTISQFLRGYGAMLFSLITSDADISGVFYRQSAWLDPPLYILAPWIIKRVAWAWIKQLIAF
ncbi:hypothetical protein Clacol_003339 [Clathrus columnatus]|uniref:FAD/NAD(P)-binding domain-containing protein n=1 Tax=Clathrus columnatus TaxID=1419009 RepID=A0AAV5A6J0_9AGAM|nr:hypothetical protein Clacol_003339 [Clathrus columnatus]